MPEARTDVKPSAPTPFVGQMGHIDRTHADDYLQAAAAVHRKLGKNVSVNEGDAGEGFFNLKFTGLKGRTEMESLRRVASAVDSSRYIPPGRDKSGRQLTFEEHLNDSADRAVDALWQDEPEPKE